MIVKNNLHINKTNFSNYNSSQKKSKNIPEEQNCAETDLNAAPSAVYNKISFGCHNNNDKHSLKYYEGCLFGGAVGDALGAPLEFQDEASIKAKYGQNGLRYLVKKGKGYKFTDDTQMTLFTTKGLLKSYLQNPSLREEPDYNEIYEAYKDWYKTQQRQSDDNLNYDSNIFDRKELYSRRSPGNTCIESLEKGVAGTVERPVNDSFANGAAMRTAPIGLMYHKNPELAFKIGVKTGALTHGNEGAYLPAGFHAGLIANIISGKSMPQAIDDTMKILKKYKNHKNFTELLKYAIKLSKTSIEPKDAVHLIGKGVRGDEALAISVYCALKSPNSYKNAVIMSVNHGGDSDTTGAITGNIMGAYLGRDAIPRNWKENMELADVIQKCSEHLYIDDKETDFLKAAKSGYEKINNRRNDDIFLAKQTHIKFFPDDVEKMKKMDVKSKLKYIQELKAGKKYLTD